MSKRAKLPTFITKSSISDGRTTKIDNQYQVSSPKLGSKVSRSKSRQNMVANGTKNLNVVQAKGKSLSVSNSKSKSVKEVKYEEKTVLSKAITVSPVIRKEGAKTLQGSVADIPVMNVNLSVPDVSTTTTLESRDDDDLPDLELCSQEHFLDSSQDDDYYCEVKWDARSPQAIRQLKKLQGQYCAEDVKKIVAHFSDAHVKPQKSSRHRMQQFFAHNIMEAKRQKPKERIAAKKRPRGQSREAVQEMINFLQELAAKQKAEKSKQEHSESTSTSNKPNEICGEPPSVVNENTSPNCDGDDDCWSDEDLFKDNSFLIEATQNPEKFLNTSRDLATAIRKDTDNTSSSKVSVVAVRDQRKGQGISTTPSHSKVCDAISSSLFDDSSVIPSSYLTKQSLLVPSASRQVTTTSSSSASSSITATARLSYAKPVHSNFNVKPNLGSADMKQTQGSKAFNATSRAVHRPGNTITNDIKNFSTSKNSFKFKPAVTSSNLICPSGHSGSVPVNTISSKANVACGPRSMAFVNKCSNQNSQIRSVNPPPGSSDKLSFGKFNNCQRDGISVDRKQPSSVKNPSPSTSLITPFRKTLSFDSSFSPKKQISATPCIKTSAMTSLNGLIKPVPVSAATNSSNSFTFKQFSTKAPPNQFTTSAGNKNKYNATLASRSVTPAKTHSSDSVTLKNDDGFDISLPDDVLMQLLEPDEVLDSQADIISSSKSLVKEETVTRLPVSSRAPANISPVTNTACRTSTAIPTVPTKFPTTKSLLATTGMNIDTKCNTFSSNSKGVEVQNATVALPSPVKHGMGAVNLQEPHQKVHSFFKKTFAVTKSGSPHPLKTLKHRQSLGPSSSTPIKFAKKDDNISSDAEDKSSANSQGCSDSFLENAFDDSFMNDEALFESQILPMLEKVESEALGASQLQVKPLANVSSPVRCSPEEIEKKRQAAIQRRSVRLSQMNNPCDKKL